MMFIYRLMIISMFIESVFNIVIIFDYDKMLTQKYFDIRYEWGTG